MDLGIDVAPVLGGSHPTALVVGQVVIAVVALVSFYFAYRTTKPLTHRTPTQKRQVKVESALGLIQLCNPGRRATDRCAICPLNDRCVKGLPPREADELARDRASVVAVQRAPASVVFVDDNAALREVVKVLLGDVGVRVRVAKDADSATPFDAHEHVLVTDWRLADGTGGEVIRAFREDHPDRAVIIVSALDHPPKDAPVGVKWMPKPFDPDELVSLVSSMLKTV